MVVFGAIATVRDPTDPTIALERKSRSKRRLVKFDKKKFSFYCDLCGTHVLERTKHCRQCNRCTADFDHHCSWINNDIGGANYRVFIALLLALVSMLVLQIATVAVALKKRDLNQRSFNIVLWINLAESVFFLLNTVYLLLFHLYLRVVKMSTFQFVRAKQNRAADSSKIIKRVDSESSEAH